jgi:hypothetical protein
LSARFRCQRQTKQRRHGVYHGFRIEPFRGHEVPSSNATRRGARPAVIFRA